MKKMLLSFWLLLLTFRVFAQISEVDSLKKYLIFKKDKFTDKITLMPRDSIYGKTIEGLEYTMLNMLDVQNKYIVISFSCQRIGCVDNMAAINYLFIDNQKYRGANTSGYNCQGMFIGIYKGFVGIEPSQLDIFNKSMVSMVRLNGNTSNAEIHFTPRQSFLIKSQITWLKYFYDNKRKLEKANIIASNMQ